MTMWKFWFHKVSAMDIHWSSYEMERQLSTMNNFPGFSPLTAVSNSPHSILSGNDSNTPNTLLSQKYSMNSNRPWYRRSYKTLQNYMKKFMESHTRKNLKYINANKHVLGTYHDSFLFGEFPVFVGIRATMRSGKIGHFWTMVRNSKANVICCELDGHFLNFFKVSQMIQ